MTTRPGERLPSESPRLDRLEEFAPALRDRKLSVYFNPSLGPVTLPIPQIALLLFAGGVGAVFLRREP